MTAREEAIWKSFAILPKAGGILSIFGEIFIVRDISMKIKAKGARSVPLTSLVLLLISIGNIPYSFFVSFMSTWMVPPLSDGDYGYVPPQFATGTVKSCTLQGLISTIGMLGFAFHYALLSILYYLLVARGWTESRMKNLGFRLFFVFFPAVIAIIGAIPPAFYHMYNYAGAYHCGVASYPMNCSTDPDIECIRGKEAKGYTIGTMIYFWCCFIIILTSMVRISFSVWRQERKGDVYLSVGEQRKRTYTVKTFQQGLRYVGVYAAGFIPATLATRFCSYEIHDKCIFNLYVVVVLLPLVPFFNALNYFRPRYMKIRNSNPEKSRMDCLCQTLGIQSDCWRLRRRESDDVHAATAQSPNANPIRVEKSERTAEECNADHDEDSIT
eukprot:CCRYP_018733-RA/>CCRYP_018733-RA protein AED:0.05 eAED:0.05 QI:283/1/1/1/0/0.5/2/217/383